MPNTPPAPAAAPAAPAPTPAPAAPGGAWMGGRAAVMQAIQGIMANPVPAAIYVGVAFVLALLAVLAHFDVTTTTTGATMDTGATILRVLVALLLIRATVVYVLSIADKKPLSVSQFLAVNIKQWLFLVIAAILATVILVVGAIPILVPWIWLIPWFSFASYVVVDQGLGPVKALGASRHLAQHHKGVIWGAFGWLFVVGIVVALLDLIPFVAYLAGPALTLIEFATLAILYRWLQSQSTVAAA